MNVAMLRRSQTSTQSATIVAMEYLQFIEIG